MKMTPQNDATVREKNPVPKQMVNQRRQKNLTGQVAFT